MSRPSFDFFYGISFEEGEDFLPGEAIPSIDDDDDSDDDDFDDDDSDEDSDDSDGDGGDLMLIDDLAKKYLLAINDEKAPTLRWLHLSDRMAEVTGCVFQDWGYDGSPGLFLAIKVSLIHGDWDDATPVPANHMATRHPDEPADWDRKLRKICDTLGIRWKEPMWQIVASGGE